MQASQASRIHVAVTALAVLITFVAVPAFAKGPAGIVLYCQWEKEVYLLLAEDTGATRGWSAFGGWNRPGETQVETAARETAEETRGYFDYVRLKEQISKQQPVQSGGFSMYFAEVPFVPAQRIANNPIGENEGDMAERGLYAWIPFKELEIILGKAHLAAPDLKINPLYLPRGSRSDSFWGVWVANMREAMKKGAFPWSTAAELSSREGS